MMRLWLFSFAIIYASLCVGQDIKKDSIQTKDTIEAKQKIKLPPINLYGEGMMVFGPTPDTYEFSRQVGLGVGYKRFSLGLFYSVFTGEHQDLVVFPNRFDLLYAHGGGYLNVLLLDSRYLDAGLRVSYSKGDMVWEYTETKEDFARDQFQVWKPEVVLAFVPLRPVKLFTAIGYARIYDLDLPAVTADGFSGLTLAFGLQIGYFNK